MKRIIEDIERHAFSECMNPPEPYRPSAFEIDMMQKIKGVLATGNAAVVKRKADGSYVVYEEVRKKV